MRMGILMRVRRITLCAVYIGLQFEVAESFPSGALIQLDVIFFTLLGKSLQSAPGSVGIKLILSCCSGFNDFVTWSVNFEAFLRKFLCRCDLGPACKVIMNYSIKSTNIHCGFHFDPSKEERHLVVDGELVVAGGDWRQVGDRVPAGEGAPWSTWFGHLRQDVVDIDFLRQI